jgi:hypothetical protein
LSGREAGRGSATPADPDSLEVVPGSERQKMEGSVPPLATPDELRVALEEAFDYRGDVLITRKDGSQIEGYVFDRRNASTLTESCVRVLPKDGGSKTSISYADIAALAFTGSWQELGIMGAPVLGQKSRRREEHLTPTGEAGIALSDQHSAFS